MTEKQDLLLDVELRDSAEEGNPENYLFLGDMMRLAVERLWNFRAAYSILTRQQVEHTAKLIRDSVQSKGIRLGTLESGKFKPVAPEVLAQPNWLEIFRSGHAPGAARIFVTQAEARRFFAGLSASNR
ncbi:MAG: hypothetical protein ACLPX9_10310 [Rhodomicrobium sp.]